VLLLGQIGLLCLKKDEPTNWFTRVLLSGEDEDAAAPNNNYIYAELPWQAAKVNVQGESFKARVVKMTS